MLRMFAKRENYFSIGVHKEILQILQHSSELNRADNLLVVVKISTSCCYGFSTVSTCTVHSAQPRRAAGVQPCALPASQPPTLLNKIFHHLHFSSPHISCSYLLLPSYHTPHAPPHLFPRSAPGVAVDSTHPRSRPHTGIPPAAPPRAPRPA